MTAIAFWLSAIMAGIRKVLRTAYAVVLIFLLNYMGDFMYQPIYYLEHENVYKVPESCFKHKAV